MSSVAHIGPPPVPSSMGWIPGALSVGLAAVSFVLCGIGYALANAGQVDCPVTEIWRGTLFAVASVGTAVPGLLCGAAGGVCGRTNRSLALTGLALNGGFGVMFYAMWL